MKNTSTHSKNARLRQALPKDQLSLVWSMGAQAPRQSLTSPPRLAFNYPYVLGLIGLLSNQLPQQGGDAIVRGCDIRR
jgi:hypothetical protein